MQPLFVAFLKSTLYYYILFCSLRLDPFEYFVHNLWKLCEEDLSLCPRGRLLAVQKPRGDESFAVLPGILVRLEYGGHVNVHVEADPVDTRPVAQLQAVEGVPGGESSTSKLVDVACGWD